LPGPPGVIVGWMSGPGKGALPDARVQNHHDKKYDIYDMTLVFSHSRLALAEDACSTGIKYRFLFILPEMRENGYKLS
jgi:hypothetical protein